MSDWQQVEEDGATYYVHKEFGNVIKLSETAYVAMVPRIIKLGPFKTLEEAQQTIVTCKTKIDTAFETLNQEFTK